MAIITREGTYPIQDGETSSGAELEAEFDKLFPLVNGTLDTNNFADAANVSGTKFANSTVAVGKFAADQLTTEEFAASAVLKTAVAVSTSTAALSTETTYQTFPIGVVFLDNLALDDWVFVDFSGRMYNEFSVFLQTQAQPVTFTFAVNGVDQADIATVRVVHQNKLGPFTGNFSFDVKGNFRISWAFQATAQSHSIVPRYKITEDFDNITVLWGSGQHVLRATAIPQK